MHLTMGQHGAFFLLLRFIYTTEKKIPHSQRYSIARALLEQECLDVDYVLEEFFTKKGDFWVSDRALEVISDTKERHEKRRIAGSLGGKAKSSNATAKAKQKPSNALLTTTITTDSNNKGHLTEYDLKDPTWKTISEVEDDAANPGNRRMFYGDVIKLREKDFNAFARSAGYDPKEDYKLFMEELGDRDNWLAEQKKSIQKNWFMSTKKYFESLGK